MANADHTHIFDFYDRRRAENKQRKREGKKAIRFDKVSPEDRKNAVRHEVAVELLSRGFLNTALGRNLKTTRAGDFYQSRDWASVRYAALLRSDGRCSCCGASRNDGAVLHVDHIKPRSKFPELSLSLDNLQVLCDLCNIAKSNIDMTDWSAKPTEVATKGNDYREYVEDGKRIVRILKGIV
jgi:hypothetical protein